MSKRILSIVLSLAMLCSAVCITGVLSVSAAGELREGGKVVATYAAVTGPEDIPADTQLNLGKVAFRYDRATGYNLQSNGNATHTTSMDEWNSGDLPNQFNANSKLQWPEMSRREINLLMSDGNYLAQYKEVTEAQSNGTANIAIPWKSGSYWETDASGNAVTDYGQKTYAGWPDSDDSQYLVYDLGDTYSVGKIGIGSGVDRPTMTAANAPGSVEELQALMGQAENASCALTKVSVYVGNDLSTLFGTPNTGSDGKTTFSGEACRVMTYDLSSAPEQALANIFTLTEAAQGRYVGFYFHYNGIPYISELAVYGSQGSSTPIDLGDSYGTTYQSLTTVEQLPERTSLIAGMQPLDGTLVGSQSTATAVTDGKFAGLNVFADYITTTSATDSSGPSDPVPGEDGLYFDYGGSYWPKVSGQAIRSVYYTDAPAGGLHFDTLYPLTFDLGYVCTIDSLAIGSTADPGTWVRSSVGGDPAPPKTVAEYITKKQDYDKESYLLKGEVYISDSRETLYDAANRVMYYDWSAPADWSKALNNLFTLQEAKTGRYVGFQFNAREQLIRVGELAVYGKVDRSVIQLTSANVNALTGLGANRLAGAERLTGALGNGSGTWDCLSDGIIYGITTNDAAYQTSKCGIIVNGADKKNPVTGEDIAGISGWGSVTFKLAGNTTLTHVLMAGSGGDEGNNRYVRYYEFYASDTQENLFTEENRIVCYDNTTNPQLAQIHTLQEAVSCRYVGVRFTGGAYEQARISEIGLYGDMDAAAQLSFTSMGTKTDYETALAGKGNNLLKGEQVGNKTHDYLDAFGMVAIGGNTAWLTDGYINWSSDEKEEKLELQDYSANNLNRFYYDLRGKVKLDSVLVAASGKDEPAYRPNRITLYLSDDPEMLFTEDNLLGQVQTGGNSTAVLIQLAEMEATGRYIGFAIPGDTQWNVLRLTELGVYGTYTTAVESLPINLLGQPNSKRVDHFQVDARGIDNVTAVGANGAPGTNGNTGDMPSKRSVRTFENLDYLTDGDWSTRSAQLSDTNPESFNESALNYDNAWIGVSYYLGGGARLDTVSLVSSNEPGYYVTGVQIYASYYYKDLYKSESLLYTTGGEHYVGNKEDGYLPDVAYEVNQRELKYELTDAQKAQEYRYLAFVVTRNFPLYKKGTDQFVLGYGIARIAELTAYGDIATPEEPLQSSWEVSTSLGTATVTVEPKNYDDREFYAQIARVTIDEEKLPDNVPRHINNNWLTVAQEKVFHLRFWDAAGNQIKGEGNDRDVMVVFPIDHQYNYFAGIIRNGVIQRLYNAYVRPDNTLRAGEINYPVYPDTEKNNRDKATYQDMDVSLVLLRWNDPRTVDTLNDNVHYGSVSEFFGTAVAGASAQRSAFPEESRSVSALWLLVPAGLAAAVLAGVWLLRRRQRGKAHQ